MSMIIQFLTLSDVKMIHDSQIHKHGGLYGLRDEKLLHSAIHYPQSFFNQQYLHLDIHHMAAAYMYAIIKNHPFLDGNKRTGLLAALIFLKLNDIIIEEDDDQLFDLAMAVAQSHITEKDIANFFKKKTIHSHFN